MMDTTTKNNRTAAASGSILFHAAFAVLLLLAMRGCGGPGDGTQYMALSIASLGEFEQGLGDPTETPVSASQPQPQESQEAEEDPVETVDESPVSAPKPADKPKQPKPTEKPVEKPVEKPAEKPKQPSDALNNAINQLGKPGNSSGNSQPGGNEGAPDGKVEGKGVFGDGTGGWSLAGRNIQQKPSLDEKPSGENFLPTETIGVDIIVDKTGNVISAIANQSTSKVSSGEAFSKLKPFAEKAARSAKFNKAEATINQRGTITIIFKF
jgi:hypothetical protein